MSENRVVRMSPRITRVKKPWNWPNIGRWALLIIVMAASIAYLEYRPEQYTPAVQFMLSIFLFAISFWIGMQNEVKKATAQATKQASDRWLPKAESVVLRLITLQYEVKRLAQVSQCSCDTTARDLPELNDAGNRAIKVKMKTECEANTRLLDNFANQLDDAIQDWTSFISYNCTGDECARLYDAIDQRREKLDNLNQQDQPQVEVKK